MKIVRKGNTYKKESWLKEHEEDIYFIFITLLGLGIFFLTQFIRS